jgi:putative peptide zinc metalloprotease protein
MTEELFTLRSDLVLVEQDGRTIIKDPVAGTYARIATAELRIAREFDGRSTLAQIQERLRASRRGVVALDKLERFRDRLRDLDFLVGSRGNLSWARRSPIGGLSLGPLARIVVIPLFGFDPDRLLTFLASRLRFIASRGFVLFSVLLGLLAADAVASSFDDLSAELAVVGLSTRTLMVVWLVSLASFAWHELGHGLATKLFGGEVRRTGVVLYYFMIVFYTDCSDAWLFTKRRQMLVIAAGAWATLLLFSISAIVWRATMPGSALHEAALIFLAFNATASLGTLLPLARGDGYHMLSTGLGVPNLRPRAFALARAELLELFGHPSPDPPPKGRDRRILIAYGAFAIPAIVATFLFFGARIATFLFEHLGGWAAVLIAVVLSLRLDVPRRLRDRLFGVAETRSKKRSLLMWIAAGAIFVIPWSASISGPFEIVSLTPGAARATEAGIVRSIRVQSGDRVERGAPLATIATATGTVAISAPASGVIVSSATDLAQRSGARVDAGEVIAEVFDPSAAVARIHIPEHELGDIAIGQTVMLRSYLDPSGAISGEVSGVEPAITGGAGVVLVPVGGASVKAGASGMAKIDCGWGVIGSILYRRLSRAMFVRLWSWW